MNERLQIFCDGIFAIAITLLILEIKVPSITSIHSSTDMKHQLLSEWPSWFAFLPSFISMYIAWVNHHHFMKQTSTEKTSNVFMYAHGLFVARERRIKICTSFNVYRISRHAMDGA